jgi:hypothetical protein
MPRNGSATSSKLDTSREATLTSEASLTCAATTSPGTPRPTSLPASADGPSPCGSPDWPDDRPVWTGSCPCQPFSIAGEVRGVGDERHLWPEWFRLIRARSTCNRLWRADCEQALDTAGSPEFILKWSRRIIRSGRRICVLRASRRSTPGNASSLWRTPAARDWRDLSEHGESIRGGQRAPPAEHGDAGLRARVCFEPNPGCSCAD